MKLWKENERSPFTSLDMMTAWTWIPWSESFRTATVFARRARSTPLDFPACLDADPLPNLYFSPVVSRSEVRRCCLTKLSA